MQSITMSVRFLAPMDTMFTQHNPSSTFTGTAAACPVATGQSDAVSTLITTVYISHTPRPESRKIHFARLALMGAGRWHFQPSTITLAMGSTTVIHNWSIEDPLQCGKTLYSCSLCELDCKGEEHRPLPSC
jgi:hypothetical protein